MDPKISVRDLTVQYKLESGSTIVVVDGFNMDLQEGTFTCIIGPSGCGKTTVLNVIAGLTSASNGTAVVDGELVTGPSPSRGVVFQQYCVFPWLTVRQNVEFPLRMAKKPKDDRRVIVDRLMELVNLTMWADSFPKELSGGMKQRVALARAYAGDPTILLMDEPFGALDAETRSYLQEELLEVWTRERRTILFVTHDVEEAVFLSQHVIVMGSRPSRILAEVKVPFPYPRSSEVRLSSDFAALRKEVWEATRGAGTRNTG